MYILTFDIEEWFHILDNESTRTEEQWSCYERRLDQNMELIFELLGRNKQKATFFCLGWVAREYPHIIRRIHEHGYEIATHSYSHQLACDQNRKEFSDDVRRSIGSIEEITGEKVKAYRAPGFSFKEKNKWVFEVLAENGIEIDCSVAPSSNSHGGFPSFRHVKPVWVEMNGMRLKEFPLNFYRMAGRNITFSGGSYFRFLPYGMIYRMMQRSDYVIAYFHPKDLDKDQPVIEGLSAIRKFKYYYGLSWTLKKLERLITDFEFTDLRTAVERYDWRHCAVQKLSTQ
jgi:polysaccharide deacetylase family protein (PEP-CTERM system associated)